MAPRFSIVPARVVDDTRIDDRAVVILVLIGTYADHNGWCFPSQTKMADRLGVSRQAIAKQIDKLVDFGYVEKRQRTRENGSNTSCLYRVIYEDRENDNPKFPEEKEEETTIVTDVASETKNVLYEMAVALAKVCHLDFNLNRGRLFKEAKDLIKSGYTEEQICDVYGESGSWWYSDFRGKRGEIPNLGAIRLSIASLLSNQINSIGPTTDGLSEGYING